MDPQRAFNALLREHGALISRIAASYEADPELARDLTQESLLAVWRALPSFREESSQRTFVARIAHNRAVSHVARAAGRPRSIEMPDGMACPSPHPEIVVLEVDRRRRVLAAIQQLPLHADGQTVMIVTHDPGVACYCRRVVRMQDGRIVAGAAQT